MLSGGFCDGPREFLLILIICIVAGTVLFICCVGVALCVCCGVSCALCCTQTKKGYVEIDAIQQPNTVQAYPPASTFPVNHVQQQYPQQQYPQYTQGYPTQYYYANPAPSQV